MVCELPFARRLVVMVKEPIAGRVKSRLAQDIGAVRAVSFYRTMLRSLLSRVVRPYRWQTYLAISPDVAAYSKIWPLEPLRVAQGGGDLGCRMQHIMDGLPPGPVVIVGSDIPGIQDSHIATAFQMLGDNDAVIGPSSDGGYWLIGLKRVPRVPVAFDGVRWSHSETLADTLQSLEPLPVGRLDVLDDVDTGKEYARLHGGAVRVVREQF